MDKEYNLMTDVSRDVISNSLKEKGYSEIEVESWESPLFRDKSFIGIKLDDVDEINFDLYQAERKKEMDFIKEPKFFLHSDIENSLMEIDEEYLMEEKGLEEPLGDRGDLERKMSETFENISDSLRKNGYKTDLYETEEGFDL
jgi:hypothetical protein